MLLTLLVAQRVFSSLETAEMEQFMACMVRDVTAEAWPDDIAAQMIHM